MSGSTPRALAAVLTFCAAPLAAAADFEGVIESKMTMEGKSEAMGTGRTYVSSTGTRQEMTFGAKAQSMTMVTLVLKARPGLVFMVNDDKKTYSELSTSAAKAAGEKAPEKFTAKRLGTEKVAGYTCAHGEAQGEKGERWEIWSTKDIPGAEGFWAGQTSQTKAQGGAFVGLMRAMKEAGLDGWPVKWSMHRPAKEGGEGGKITWEATRIERRSVPGSLLSLSGYTKSEGEGMLGAMGQMKLSPEQQKQMDAAMKQQQEAMKKMTPEQRQKMEEMMKALQGGQRPQ